MSSLVLIDTSVWILALRKAFVPAVKDAVEELLYAEKAATSPMVRMELLGGAKYQTEFDRLQQRLDSLHQLPLDDAVWEEAAKLGFRLRRAGKSVPSTDMIIAASAIQADTLLLHADRHFDLIASQETLKVESLVHLIP